MLEVVGVGFLPEKFPECCVFELLVQVRYKHLAASGAGAELTFSSVTKEPTAIDVCSVCLEPGSWLLNAAFY